jgi:hypothetical protein
MLGAGEAKLTAVLTDRPLKTAHIAQLAEHALGKGEVIGSNPIVGSSQASRLLKRLGRKQPLRQLPKAPSVEAAAKAATERAVGENG